MHRATGAGFLREGKTMAEADSLVGQMAPFAGIE